MMTAVGRSKNLQRLERPTPGLRFICSHHLLPDGLSSGTPKLGVNYDRFRFAWRCPQPYELLAPQMERSARRDDLDLERAIYIDVKWRIHDTRTRDSHKSTNGTRSKDCYYSSSAIKLHFTAKLLFIYSTLGLASFLTAAADTGLSFRGCYPRVSRPGKRGTFDFETRGSQVIDVLCRSYGWQLPLSEDITALSVLLPFNPNIPSATSPRALL